MIDLVSYHSMRGNSIPELKGSYIFADYGSGRIWKLEYDGINPATNTEIIDSALNIATFGIDKNKELYIGAFDGKIHEFVPTKNLTISSSVFETSNQNDTTSTSQSDILSSSQNDSVSSESDQLNYHHNQLPIILSIIIKVRRKRKKN